MALTTAYIEENVSKVPFSGCWIWTLGCTTAGYGIALLGGNGRRGPKKTGQGKHVYVHRISYELHKGQIPSGHVVMHECDVPGCVNPDHLSIGTQKENMADMARKGRRVNAQLAGEKHTQAKLTDSQALEIFNSSLRGVDLARMYGVSPNAISRIKLKRRWTHIHKDASKC